MEKKTEVVIVNYIEKMLGERREKIIESDEYIRQDIEDLKELEERYASKMCIRDRYIGIPCHCETVAAHQDF